MNSNIKPQAASHMFWFFLLPCLGFMIWASVKLIRGISHKEAPTPLLTKVLKIKDAKSPGDRWQNAYALSQDIQKILHTGGLEQLPSKDKDLLFSEMAGLLEKNSSDTRLKRYLLLTLGQMQDSQALPILKQYTKDLDAEVSFFSSWGMIEILSKHPDAVSLAYLDEIVSWLDSKDASLQKISASFLVQQKNPEYITKVKSQLSSANLEVRWNAGVALASVKEAAAASTLKEIFDVTNLRQASIKSTKDLEQLIAAAADGAVKLGDASVLAKGIELRNSLDQKSPESKAIYLGLRALPDQSATAPTTK
jgi:HEAT repeat protein